MNDFFWKSLALVSTLLLAVSLTLGPVQTAPEPRGSVTVSAFSKTRGDFMLVDPAMSKVVLYRVNFQTPERATFQFLGMTDYHEDIAVHEAVGRPSK